MPLDPKYRPQDAAAVQARSYFPLDAATTSTATFQYEPLDAGQQQIRLLKITPDKADQPIRCTLSAFRLESRAADADPQSGETAPQYLALSYMWAAPTTASTFHVFVNGKKFEISENLYRFFVDFRAEEEDIYLWIDQISIDQGNHQERSAQVQIMGTIYKSATEVVIWLGDDSDKLQEAGRRLKTENVHASKQDALDANMDALITLLKNKYFTRLWIVQEIILARKVRVLIRGNVWASWEKMLEVFYHLHGLQGSINKCNISPSAAWLLHHQNTKPPSRSLSTWIEAFGENDCEDPRDKVYGLMALVYAHERLSVDYTKSVIEVYLDVIVVFWEAAASRDGTARIDTTQMAILVKLGKCMGLNEFQLGGVRTMLHDVPDPWNLWVKGAPKRLRVITRVGYESAGARIRSKGIPRADAQTVVDQWWFEVDGKRHYHECRLFAPGKHVVREGWGRAESTSCFEREVDLPAGIMQSPGGRDMSESTIGKGFRARRLEQVKYWTKRLRRQSI